MVNMGLINLGYGLIPLEGIDPNNLDDLAKVMPTLEAKYFIFPFLAHAMGTLVGVGVAAAIAGWQNIKYALYFGVLYLLGGIAAAVMIPAPTWFLVVDLGLAYLPMAWLGGTIAAKLFSTSSN